MYKQGSTRAPVEKTSYPRSETENIVIDDRVDDINWPSLHMPVGSTIQSTYNASFERSYVDWKWACMNLVCDNHEVRQKILQQFALRSVRMIELWTSFRASKSNVENWEYFQLSNTMYLGYYAYAAAVYAHEDNWEMCYQYLSRLEYLPMLSSMHTPDTDDKRWIYERAPLHLFPLHRRVAEVVHQWRNKLALSFGTYPMGENFRKSTVEQGIYFLLAAVKQAYFTALHGDVVSGCWTVEKEWQLISHVDTAVQEYVKGEVVIIHYPDVKLWVEKDAWYIATHPYWKSKPFMTKGHMDSTADIGNTMLNSQLERACRHKPLYFSAHWIGMLLRAGAHPMGKLYHRDGA
jgi:hypothetical protein